MRKLIFICGIINLFSCGYLSSNTDDKLPNKENSSRSLDTIKTDTIQSLLSKNIEKVIIEYWDNYYANNFIFEINGKGTEICYWGEILFTEKKTLTKQVVRNRLIDYINLFYIDKGEDIILGANENEPVITENPSLNVMMFKNGKQIAKEEINIESHINYHPQYIEFYQLLDSLVKNK